MENFGSIRGLPTRASSGRVTCGNARQVHGLATCSSACSGPSELTHGLAIGEGQTLLGRTLSSRFKDLLQMNEHVDLNDDSVSDFIATVRNMCPKSSSYFRDSRVHRPSVRSLHPAFRPIFKPINTTGDGNCFYNALSVLYFGDENRSHWFRLAIAMTVSNHREKFNALLADLYPGQSRDLRKILRDVLTNGVWANEFVTLAATAVLLKPITMLSDQIGNNPFKYADHNISGIIADIVEDPRYFGSCQIFNVILDPAPAHVYMMHVNGNHYVAVVSSTQIELPFREFQNMRLFPLNDMINAVRLERLIPNTARSDKNGASSLHSRIANEATPLTEVMPYESVTTNSLRRKKSDNTAAERMRRIRSKPAYAAMERVKNRESKRKTREKGSDASNQATPEPRMSRNSEVTEDRFEDSINQFLASVKEGPTHVCYVCDNLWFAHSVKRVLRKTFTKYGIANTINSCESIEICFTCNEKLRKCVIPEHSWINGKRFPVIPNVIKQLNPLEEILVSPRIPFMTIRPLGRDRQYGLKGAVVNVPIDVPQTLSCLPRKTNDTHLISVQLKRKMEYKSAYHKGSIRSSDVVAAAKILTQKPLYKQHGITFSSNWKADTDCPDESDAIIKENDILEIEDEEPLNPGGQETLLCSENDMIIAPGEGKIPINLLFDEDCEELCFPSLFGGEKNPFKFMKPGERAKFMARHRDRRCSKIPYLFFLYKRLEMEKLNNIINICIRKRKRGNLTAGDCLDDDFMNSVFLQDEGYKFMKSLRSSPAYWEAKKKDVFAMIRQLGFPTLFMTFSAAESKWRDLLIILKRIVDNEEVTEDVVENLTYDEKARLIRSDPITCSRYFENKFRNFLHKIILNEDGPFKNNPVKDYYIRFEFQHRGSVHAHMIVWLENAPLYDKSNLGSKTGCVRLIDSLISCTNDDSISELIPFQTHKHSFTCRKSSNMQCRFGIPFYPMKETDIIDPLDERLPPEEEKRLKKLRSSIKNGLNEHRFTDIDDMLNEYSLSYDEYIVMLRATLKRPRVFLKRSVHECFINAYNKTLLTLFQANMDIQFIVEPYACATYIIDYINKSNRSMSLLMRNVVRQLNTQDITVKKKLQTIASKFINATEISAQEAAYHILELPLSRSSRQVMYINTGRPEERVRMLKCQEELAKLEADSEEIFHHNIHDYYCNRPDDMEEICLADFAANYNVTKSHRSRNSQSNTTKSTKLKNGLGYIRSRQKPKIIRYRRYCEDQDPNEYRREQLTLFYPWRDESHDILEKDIMFLYNEHADIIERNRSRYIRSSISDRDDSDSIQTDDASTTEGEYGAYTRQDGVEGNIGNDNGNRASVIPFRRIKFQGSDFSDKIKCLNQRQYKYALSLWRRMCERTQIFDFVTGGAGTGKSRLIEAISLCIDRYFNIVCADIDSNLIRSVVCAPTGKAAFNIRGLTLHSAFCIPVTQNKEAFCPLSADKLNTLRCRLHGLKFVIIDEISMVGAKLFQQVDNRLRQIFDPAKAFGGISVIVFGDFNQLKPVCDSYVFKGVVNNPYHAVAGDALWRNFNFFELKEIMRQKDDIPFATALQNFAACGLSESDIKLLREREITSTPDEAIHLFASNEEVDNYNQIALARLDTFGIICEARDTCYGSESANVREGYLKSLKESKPTETGGFHTIVHLKISAKYMIIDNIDIEDGLVNGAIGKLIYISLDDTNSLAQIAWMHFDDPNVGIKARSRYRQESPDCKNWAVPVFRVTKHISNKGYHKQLQIYRTQFPVIPAEAITIHKSQGSTYKSVAYHVGKYVSHASAYVALSRATSANGLYIIGTLKTFTSPNAVVETELQRLKERPSATEYDHLMTREHLEKKIVSFNIQSLLPHIDQILSDPCLNNSDVVCLVETWTVNTDVIETGPFRLISRIDCGQVRNPSGIVVLARDGVECEHVHNSVIRGVDYSVNINVVTTTDDLFIVSIYVSPKTPTIILKEALINVIAMKIPKKSRVIITGDFNLSYSVTNSLFRSVFMDRNISMSSCNQPSTYLNTQIDYTYSNVLCKATYYDSFMSYHRPQIILIPKRINGKKKHRFRKYVVRLQRNIFRKILPRIVSSIIPKVYVYIKMHNYRFYLRGLCRKRNRQKKMLPQHKLVTSVGCTR